MVMNDKAIRIVNREAIRLAKLRAQREGRSAANAASVTIIEALGKKPGGKNTPPDPAFLDQVVCKDNGSGAGLSNEKGGP
jgi:hypothetical protein